MSLYTRPQLKAASLRRGLSRDLWSQAPNDQIDSGAIDEGFGFKDEFLTFDDDRSMIIFTK